MSEEAVSQPAANNSDSCADAFAAIASVTLFVVTLLFWISNQ